MGITLQQALAQGATIVPPKQSAAVNAYQALVKNLPSAALPPKPTATAPQPNLAAKAGEGLLNFGKTVVSSVKSGVQNGVKDLTDTIDESSSKQAQGGFQAVGEASKAVLSPVTDAITGIANALAGNKTVQKVANSAVGNAAVDVEKAGSSAASPITDKLNQWAAAHPEAAKDLGALGNIAVLATSLDAGEEGLPGVAKEGAGAIKNAAGKLTDALPETAAETLPPEQTLASRIADATPDYNKKMVSQYIKNSDDQLVPRVNEGEGLTGARTVNTSKSEAANGVELNNIANYPDKGTSLQKAQAVHQEILNEATNLDSLLAAEDKANPLIADTAKQTVYKNVFDNMNGDARDAFVLRGRGLEEKAGISTEPAKTIVGRYGQDVADALGDYNGTRQGLLKLRQKLDAIYQDARGKSAFGSDHRNALDDMHTSVRNYINKELHESTSSTNVQGSLNKQSKLYRAKDVLDDKAEAEATSHYGRILQDHPVLRRVSNVLSRQGIMVPVRILEALAGVTALSAAARKLTSKK